MHLTIAQPNLQQIQCRCNYRVSDLADRAFKQTKHHLNSVVRIFYLAQLRLLVATIGYIHHQLHLRSPKNLRPRTTATVRPHSYDAQQTTTRHRNLAVRFTPKTPTTTGYDDSNRNYDALRNLRRPPCTPRVESSQIGQNDMSQYRAYFVPGAMDPLGKQIFTKCDITDFLNTWVTQPYSRTQVQGGFIYHASRGFTESNNSGQYVDEILSAMMSERFLFRVKGQGREEAISNLDHHIAVRISILRNAQSKVVRFGGPHEPNIPNGASWAESWALINDPQYAIFCLRATQLVFNAATEGNNRRRTVSSFIPGDWGYIFNDEHSVYDGAPQWPGGLEGENVIYMTGGLFWGHISDKQVYQTQEQWFNMIRGWSDDSANPSETGAPRWRTTVDYPSAGLE